MKEISEVILKMMETQQQKEFYLVLKCICKLVFKYGDSLCSGHTQQYKPEVDM